MGVAPFAHRHVEMRREEMGKDDGRLEAATRCNACQESGQPRPATTASRCLSVIAVGMLVESVKMFSPRLMRKVERNDNAFLYYLLHRCVLYHSSDLVRKAVLIKYCQDMARLLLCTMGIWYHFV